MDTLSRDELRALMEVKDNLCVSIYMPTHRTGDVQQDPIRLKNLVNQAQEKLAAYGLRPAAAREMLQPIQNYVDNTLFWQNRSEGLAIFVSPDSLRFGHLPYRFDESVNVGRRFVIKLLLPVLSGNNHFYLLAVAQNAVKLLRATQYGADEIDLKGLTPLSLADTIRFDEFEKTYSHSAATGVLGGTIQFQQQNPMDKFKTELLRFCQDIDRGLRGILKDEKAPLLFAGVEFLFPIYQAANSYQNLLPQPLPGNPQGLNTDKLRELGWKAVQPYFQKDRDAALAKYQTISGKGYTSSNIAEIVPAAYYGRIDTLFLALGPQVWGSFNPDTGAVTVHPNAETNDVDLIDFAAAYTLSQKGSGYTFAADRVFDHSPVAAMFRY